MRLLLAVVAWLSCSVAIASAQATGPLNAITLPRAPEASVTVRPVLPAWVAMPLTARILTSRGLEVRPLRNSAVTWENAKLGVLVGALTNDGSCARDVRAFLQYTDHRWQPMGDPIESEARVSQVEPGGVFPYRFRLKRTDDFPVAPSGYILQVVQDGQPVAGTLEWVTETRRPAPEPCGAPPVSIETTVTQSRSTLSGYRVAGTLTVTAGGPVRPDAITLTALLRDAGGDVLEVLTGVPVVKAVAGSTGHIEPGQTLPFALSTGVPLGKAVTSTTIFVEVLGAAQAPPR